MGGGAKQTNESADWLKPKKLMRDAWRAYSRTPKTPYGGPYSADPNQLQKDAVAWTANHATELGTGANQLRGYGQDLLSGKYLSPDSNPYVAGMAEAATRGASDNYRRNVRPGIDSAAIAQGAYGGSRNGIQQGLAASEIDKNIRDTYAGIYGDNYARERQYMQDAPQYFDFANQLTMAPAQALGAAGDQVYSWQDQKVKDAMAKWNEMKNAPWSGLDRLAAIFGQLGSQNNSSSQAGAPWWQQLIQGGIGLGGLAGAFGA